MTLKVATYNIHGWVGTDGLLDFSRVAGVLRASGASICGLQEVLDPMGKSGDTILNSNELSIVSPD